MVVEVNVDYDTWVRSVQKNFPKVELDSNTETRIQDLCKRIAEVKQKEAGYITDNNKIEKRFMTGLLGEAALEKLLGINIIDWEVGESVKYDAGDLRNIGLNCGVKTVEYGKFPLIHSLPVRPEIIILKHPSILKFMICGVYTVDVLRTYQHRQFVIDSSVRDTKTGFYGIPFSKIFKSYDELKKLL